MSKIRFKFPIWGTFFDTYTVDWDAKFSRLRWMMMISHSNYVSINTYVFTGLGSIKNLELKHERTLRKLQNLGVQFKLESS